MAGIVQTKFAYIQMRWKRAKNKISLRYYIYIFFFILCIATKEKKKKPNVVDCERAEEQRP